MFRKRKLKKDIFKMAKKKSNMPNVQLSIVVSLVFEEYTTVKKKKKLVHYDGELRYIFSLVGNSTR